MNIFTVTQAYNLLSNSKMTSLDASDKYKVLSAARSLKKVSDDYQSFIESAKEKAKDDKELNEIASKEAVRECNVEIEKVGNDVFEKLMQENGWTIGQTVVLEDLIK